MLLLGLLVAATAIMGLAALLVATIGTQYRRRRVVQRALIIVAADRRMRQTTQSAVTSMFELLDGRAGRDQDEGHGV